MTGKLWQFIGGIIVLFILINIAVESIQPFLPLVGIVLAIAIVVAVLVGLTKLVVSKHRFW
jgi:hypothetical protein